MQHAEENLRILGDQIRKVRKTRGLTQEQLAHEAEIDRSYMGGVERGERNITFTMLCRIATALETDVAGLTMRIPSK